MPLSSSRSPRGRADLQRTLAHSEASSRPTTPRTHLFRQLRRLRISGADYANCAIQKGSPSESAT